MSPGLSVRIATRGTGNLTRAGASRVHSDLEFIFREVLSVKKATVITG